MYISKNDPVTVKSTYIMMLLLDSLCSYKVVAKENQSLGSATSNLTQVTNTRLGRAKANTGTQPYYPSLSCGSPIMNALPHVTYPQARGTNSTRNPTVLEEGKHQEQIPSVGFGSFHVISGFDKKAELAVLLLHGEGL